MNNPKQENRSPIIPAAKVQRLRAGKSLHSANSQNQQKALFREIAEHLDGFDFCGDASQLSGGLLNYVWRIDGKKGSEPPSLIVKWAPPFVASSPQLKLDPERIYFEAKAMAAFSEEGQLRKLRSDAARPPDLFLLDRENHLLVMEDVCQCADLKNWIENKYHATEAKEIGKKLGQFIGKLHLETFGDEIIAREFNNHKIQNTRLEVLYKGARTFAEEANLKQAEVIGKIARDYGNRLQETGTSLIMGDLWLPSIFVLGKDVRIIDWELCHFGRPSQDVGHFAAHLWMHKHAARSDNAKQNAGIILEEFLRSYRATLSSDFPRVFGSEGLRESAVHFGSEVLTRTVGTFQDGFLYDGLPATHPKIREAADVAAAHFLDPFVMHTFDALK